MDRKIGLLALSLVLGATLAGCGNTASTEPSAPAVAPTGSPIPEVATTPDTVARGRVDGGMWSDDVAPGAGNMARDAINGAGDVARDVTNGVEGMLRDAGNAARDVGNGMVDPTW